jgi:hypothetical protein
MSFGTYFSSVYTLLGLAGLVATCGFAWWKGGPPERLGSLMLAIAWVGADTARGFSNQMVPTITLFVSDIVLAVGFLYIAIRYSSLWLGAVMMFQAIEFALHAIQLNSTDAPRWHGWILYLLINNLLNYLLLLTLTGGTVATILRRRRQVREKAAAEARLAERGAGAFRVQPRPPAAAI